ncbi:MAG: hypothetical protein IJO85_05315 [Lachnospiraceae bacterium]|nr:hypothetical protein [Lachnospiraceae bacterium]
MKRKKWNVQKILGIIYPNRKYKDRLFQRVFQKKEDLLDLYNAINHTAYTNSDDLEITTLEDAIYLSMKNDLSFVISATLNLYEQQSTFCPNMPIRGLMYFSRLYEAYIKEKNLDIYGRSLIKLPLPQYIIFYNGREKQPDELVLKLSDAFEGDDILESALECRARMMNINLEHNQKLMQSCKRLYDYSYFIAEINRNLDSGLILVHAIRKAIDTCIEQDILKDILLKSKSEVVHMLLTEYDEKKHLKHIYKEGYEEGQLKAYERINQLYDMLLAEGRNEDMKKAMKNPEYLEKLFKEYGI